MLCTRAIKLYIKTLVKTANSDSCIVQSCYLGLRNIKNELDKISRIDVNSYLIIKETLIDIICYYLDKNV